MGRDRQYIAKQQVSYRSSTRKRARHVRSTLVSKPRNVNPTVEHLEDFEELDGIDPNDSTLYTNELDNDSDDIGAEHLNSRFKDYVNTENTAWNDLFQSGLLQHGLASHYSIKCCVLCGSKNGKFRCVECHLISVCSDCLQQKHGHQPPTCC